MKENVSVSTLQGADATTNYFGRREIYKDPNFPTGTELLAGA
jgi:hypothetical protein